jgi:4-hydroxybenzoate polyprenyltransferase
MKVSSNPLPVDAKHMVISATVAFACALLLTAQSTPLLWVWITLGVLTTFGYSLTRRIWYSNEILAGIAWSTIFFGTYTLFTNNLLPPLNVLLLFVALAGYYGFVVFVYRVITGDYGCPIERKIINKLILQLFISTMILGLSIAV